MKVFCGEGLEKLEEIDTTVQSSFFFPRLDATLALPHAPPYLYPLRAFQVTLLGGLPPRPPDFAGLRSCPEWIVTIVPSRESLVPRTGNTLFPERGRHLIPSEVKASLKENASANAGVQIYIP